MRFQSKTLNSVLFRLGETSIVFLVNLLIARLFTAQFSGELYYWISILNLILLLASMNLETGINYCYNTKKLTSQSSFFISICAAVILTFFATIGLYIAGNYMNVYYSMPFSLSFIIGSFLTSVFQLLFYKQGNFKTPFLIQCFVGVFLLVVAVVLSSRFNNPENFSILFSKIYLGSFFLSGVIYAVAFFCRYIYKDNSESEFFVSGKNVFRILSYSGIALISNLITFLIYRLDYFFVEKFCSNTDLGNYIQVNKLNALFFLLPRIIAVNTFIMAASEKNDEKMTKYLEKISRHVLSFSLLGGIFILIFGSWLFPFVFGESYNKMYYIFILMFVGVCFYVVATPFAAYFAAKNRVKVNLLSGLIAVLCMIIGNMFFTKQFGVTSAAISCCLAYSIQAIIILAVYKRKNKLRLMDVILIKREDLLFFLSYLRTNKVK